MSNFSDIVVFEEVTPPTVLLLVEVLIILPDPFITPLGREITYRGINASLVWSNYLFILHGLHEKIPVHTVESTYSCEDQHEEASRWPEIECRILNFWKEMRVDIYDEFTFQEPMGILKKISQCMQKSKIVWINLIWCMFRIPNAIHEDGHLIKNWTSKCTAEPLNPFNNIGWGKLLRCEVGLYRHFNNVIDFASMLEYMLVTL
jgi:hypothetical protein